ncbi:hypothetical protein OPV22_007083 [Ensete ventricosum]|uniref:Uncharacterized protein n=1 Tax=Ensete ventricosum TaxID=4639 RepID=A0AAV8QDC7_ENSVE|nr:hypothetical protein OPV22_007083 [Ensete ventricosum]
MTAWIAEVQQAKKPGVISHGAQWSCAFFLRFFSSSDSPRAGSHVTSMTNSFLPASVFFCLQAQQRLARIPTSGGVRSLQRCLNMERMLTHLGKWGNSRFHSGTHRRPGNRDHYFAHASSHGLPALVATEDDAPFEWISKMRIGEVR